MSMLQGLWKDIPRSTSSFAQARVCFSNQLLKIYHLYNRDCDPTHFIWVCLDSGFWDMLILIIWVHWLAQERSQAARPVQGVYPDVPCQFLL